MTEESYGNKNHPLKDNPRLRKTSRPVTKINKHITDLFGRYGADNVRSAGRRTGGSAGGRAAARCGDRCWRRTFGLINPEIIHAEGQQRVEEGCLSLPDDVGFVIRPVKVTVRALDRSGEEHEYVGRTFSRGHLRMRSTIWTEFYLRTKW